MQKAHGNLELRAVDDEQRIFEGYANSASVDSHGTILEPSGAEFTLPLPLHYHHDNKRPVGSVIAAEIRSGKLWVRGHLPRIPDDGTEGGREVKRRVDAAWADIKHGLIRGLSVEFLPIEPKSHNAKRWIRWAFHALGLVSVPSNMDASIINIRSLAASGESSSPGVSGNQPNPKPRRTMLTIQEQIQQHENSRAAKVAQRETILAKCGEEGRGFEPDEKESMDSLQREVDGHNEFLSELYVQKRNNETRAVPVNGASPLAASESRGGVPIVRVQSRSEPGTGIARFVRAVGLSYRQHRDIESVVRSLYPDDDQVRAAVAAHTTANSSALVSAEGGIFDDFVAFLRPETIIGKFGTNGIPNLRPAAFRAPLITQTGGGAGYWTGEGAGKGVTRFTWTKTTIDPLKVANIAVVTDELLKSSSPAADRMIRDSLVEALRERMDTDFIDPAKAADAGISPASITNAATPIASSGTDADSVKEDLQALMANFIAAKNPPTTGVWIMSATRALALSLMENALGNAIYPNLNMSGGSFAGLPVIVSEYVDTGLVVLLNASDIYLADEGGFEVAASTEASIEMDSEPTNHSGTPTAATMVSMFQTNSVAIRAERTINWALRRATAVQVLEDVYWGGTAPT